MSGVSLIRYNAARNALAEAHRIDEVKDIRDKAIAMQEYSRQAKDKQLIEHSTDIRSRAERKAGQLLDEMAKRGERARPEDFLSRGSHEGTTGGPTLKDLGVTKKESHNWQKLGRMEEQEFEARVSAAKKLAVSSLDRPTKEERRSAAIAKTNKVEFEAKSIGKFSIIYADPPWRYEAPPMGGSNRSIENKYPTMSLDEICALPVCDIAYDDAVLFMWATAPKLAECMKVIEAWGFTYRTNMVWVKDKIGMGYYVRNQHEILLICRRGEMPPPPEDARLASILHAPRLDHSAKPDVFYNIIEGMYPGLRKIELFSRKSREGWDVWGNQVDP